MIISISDSKKFISCYAKELEEFLHIRKIELSENGGLSEEGFLHRLDKYINEQTDERIPLTSEFWDDWMSRKPHEKVITQSKRLNSTKKVIRYLRSTGIQADEPRIELRHTQSDYVPYIFSDDEIASIFAAADNYPSTQTAPYLHLSVPITFRILYGCGMRVSELLNLKISDIDINNMTIYIKNAKFNKARYVPFSASLAKHLNRYLKERHAASPMNFFFIAKTENRPYCSNEVHYWFMKLLKNASIDHHGKGYGPRVHDFRHTFAVHCLRRYILEGGDVSTMLPVLSAYLGHKDLRGTQTYLRLTTELYPHVISALKEKHGTLIEGGVSDAD